MVLSVLPFQSKDFENNNKMTAAGILNPQKQLSYNTGMSMLKTVNNDGRDYLTQPHYINSRNNLYLTRAMIDFI